MPVRLPNSQLAILLSALVSQASLAQQAPAKPAVATELAPVVVTGSADRDDRRESTVAKIVVTRDELTRFGDATVADVLNRVPGVTVSGTPGRGAEIRMRGLGAGYTQILLNGEPVAPGFSLDSLSPNLIERIEVMRSATADQSAQAIAGTINIILKQVVRSGQRDMKAAVSSERGYPSFNLDGQLSDRDGPVSYTLAASLRNQKTSTPAHVLIAGKDEQDQTVSARSIERRQLFEATTLSLTPRLTWAASERDKLVADGLLSWQTYDVATRDARRVLFGDPPLYGDTDAQDDGNSGTLRTRLTWTRSLSDGATIELKLGSSLNRRSTETHRRSVLPGQDFDSSESLALERFINTAGTDTGITLNGKYRAPFQETHAFVLGWDGESNRRSENITQRTPISLLEPTENLDQAYVAQVRRLAFFAQDEWEITPRWSAYLGLRWEGLQTTSNGSTLDSAVKNRSSVLSPILQNLWKIPDTTGDQVRLGLSRTYKAPVTRDLIARRDRNYDNSPTSPDNEGNPNLRPELAWGLDAAYERHFDDAGGLLSANVFVRKISDVILQQLWTDTDGRWVVNRVNKGDARTHGIELEAKGNLRQLTKSAPAIDLRFNLARNWSVLSAVPGPNNRLASQYPVTANIGADWRPEGLPLTFGGNWSLQRVGWIRVSDNLIADNAVRRTLDVYGLWKMDASTQFRLTLNNLLRQDGGQSISYLYGGGSLDQTTIYPTVTTLRLQLEMKL